MNALTGVDRQRTLRVVVSARECAQIEERATASGSTLQSELQDDTAGGAGDDGNAAFGECGWDM